MECFEKISKKSFEDDLDYIKNKDPFFNSFIKNSNFDDSIKSVLKNRISKVNGDKYYFFNEVGDCTVKNFFGTAKPKYDAIFNFKLNDYSCLDSKVMDNLESIAYNVNNSLVYDIDRARTKCKSLEDYRSEDLNCRGIVLPLFEYAMKKKGLDNENIVDAVLDKMENGKKFKGICSDSAALMCRAIENKNLPVYYYNQNVKTSYGTYHAVVICFDENGNWVALNGKRPRDSSKDFAIIPKEYFADGTFKFE